MVRRSAIPQAETAARHCPDVDQINLVAFHEAMAGVANYLDAADTTVSEHLSTKREMDSYYAAEFGPDWSNF
jgi:hypothetical protein